MKTERTAAASMERLQEENDRLKLALKAIAATRTQHLRLNQMQAALHSMKEKARNALQGCKPDNLESALPWL